MGLMVSSPTMLPMPELGLRMVEATNTPPGLKTLLISATCIRFAVYADECMKEQRQHIRQQKF